MPDPPRVDIRLGHEVHETENLPGALLMDRAAKEGLHEIRSANWPTSGTSLEAVGAPIARATMHGGESALTSTWNRSKCSAASAGWRATSTGPAGSPSPSTAWSRGSSTS